MKKNIYFIMDAIKSVRDFIVRGGHNKISLDDA
jgi:hypothetical protein